MVFVSYSREDRAFVDGLVETLRASGVAAWHDSSSIAPTSNWSDAIDQGIKQAECFLIVLSPHSVASRPVQAEIHAALRLGKRVLPLLIDRCEVPRDLRPIQHIDLTVDRTLNERTVTGIVAAVRGAVVNTVAPARRSGRKLLLVGCLLGMLVTGAAVAFRSWNWAAIPTPDGSTPLPSPSHPQPRQPSAPVPDDPERSAPGRLTAGQSGFAAASAPPLVKFQHERGAVLLVDGAPAADLEGYQSFLRATWVRLSTGSHRVDLNVGGSRCTVAVSVTSDNIIPLDCRPR
jgi:hypothetical protein